MTITELKALEARATKGPFEVVETEYGHEIHMASALQYGEAEGNIRLLAALRNAAPHLLAVAEAAKQLRLIQWQRETDEAEHAASGRTFSISHIAKAESDLDATLTALENA